MSSPHDPDDMAGRAAYEAELLTSPLRHVSRDGTPLPSAPQSKPPPDTDALVREFHDTYERLAPQFGYATREETRTFDPNSPNGRLMTAVISAVMSPKIERLTRESDEAVARERERCANAAQALLNLGVPELIPSAIKATKATT